MSSVTVRSHPSPPPSTRPWSCLADSQDSSVCEEHGLFRGVCCADVCLCLCLWRLHCPHVLFPSAVRSNLSLFLMVSGLRILGEFPLPFPYGNSPCVFFQCFYRFGCYVQTCSPPGAPGGRASFQINGQFSQCHLLNILSFPVSLTCCLDNRMRSHALCRLHKREASAPPPVLCKGCCYFSQSILTDEF